MHSLFSRAVGVGDPLPDELELKQVALLLTATYQETHPLDRVAETHARLYRYLSNGFLVGYRRVDAVGKPPLPLNLSVFSFPARGFFGERKTPTSPNQSPQKSPTYEPEQNFVTAESVSLCLMKTDDPMKDAPGVVAWIASHRRIEPALQEISKEAAVSNARPKEPRPSNKQGDDVSLTRRLRLCLPEVMESIASAPTPDGDPFCKANPYFPAIVLGDVLRDLDLLDEFDTKNQESFRKTLIEVLKHKGYCFKQGRPAGTPTERQALVKGMVDHVRSDLGTGTIQGLKSRLA